MTEVNPTAASLLGFLYRHGPMTGWGIITLVEGTIGHFWNTTRSQVYRELRALAERGLVNAGEAGVREKREFSITDEGRRVFVEWLNEEPSDEIIRFPLLLKLCFAEDLEPDRLARFLLGQRLVHERRLETYRSLLPELEVTEPQPAEVCRFGIMYEETILAWMDSLPSPEKLTQATRTRPVKGDTGKKSRMRAARR
ncbi:MAG: PadR family transcriptional regulator [Acidimicrobiia bacterium]|nr:PadR family transcriptional regulator [Acidimicrobiia bacterium]